MTAQNLIQQLEKAPPGEKQRFLGELRQFPERIVERISKSIGDKLQKSVRNEGGELTNSALQIAENIVCELQTYYRDETSRKQPDRIINECKKDCQAQANVKLCQKD